MNRVASQFVLVKWVDEELWDVLPVKYCVGDLANNLNNDVVGKIFDFYWKKGEESAPCTVLAYGKL